MKNQISAVCILLFTVFLVIACFWCLAPVFTTLTGSFVFLCQVVSLKILYEVFTSLVKYIQKLLADRKEETVDKTNK